MAVFIMLADRRDVLTEDRRVPPKKRSEEVTRAKLAEIAARHQAEREARRKRQMVLGTVAGVVIVVAAVVAIVIALVNGGSSSPAAAASSSADASVSAPADASASPTSTLPATAEALPATVNCTYEKTTANLPKDMKAPSLPPASDVSTTKAQTATLTTDQGTITITLDPKTAPCTVNSFVSLAKQNYFNNTKCHRLVTDGALQCGDPTGTGTGGPGYQFASEGLSQQTKYTAGVVAMANAGEGTNGSQFFIVPKDYAFPQDYTIFGKVTGGMDVVQKVNDAGVESGTADTPKIKMDIKSVTIK